MRYSIDVRNGYLHATVIGRQSADDMREFLHAVQAACRQHGCSKVLMAVRASRAIFKPEDYGLSSYVPELVSPNCRIALLADAHELHAAHEYIALVARQKGIDTCAFREETAAVLWVLGAPESGSAPGAPANLTR